jgi:hypothetical protein
MSVSRNSLFQSKTKQRCFEELTNNFEGCLIENYEQALELGIRPRDALAIVLAWVAAETRRLDPSSFRPPQST